MCRAGDRPTAGAARRADSAPERMRLGALARHITDELPVLQSRESCAWPGTSWKSAAPVSGRRRGTELSPAGMATIRALAPGRARWCPARELLAALPGSGTDTHAVETAVLRLRTALGDKHIVSTVVKRGYRLAVDDFPAGVA